MRYCKVRLGTLHENVIMFFDSESQSTPTAIGILQKECAITRTAEISIEVLLEVFPNRFISRFRVYITFN